MDEMMSGMKGKSIAKASVFDTIEKHSKENEMKDELDDLNSIDLDEGKFTQRSNRTHRYPNVDHLQDLDHMALNMPKEGSCHKFLPYDTRPEIQNKVSL